MKTKTSVMIVAILLLASLTTVVTPTYPTGYTLGKTGTRFAELSREQSHSPNAAVKMCARPSYDYGVMTSRNPNEDLVWGSADQLTNNPWNEEWVDVATAPDGSIWAVYQADKDDNWDIYCMIYRNDAWEGPSRLTSTAETEQYPSVLATKDGSVWVAWMGSADDSFEIYLAVFKDGAWSTPKRLTKNTVFDGLPVLGQTSDGTIWIFWSSEDYVTSTINIYYQRLSSKGEAIGYAGRLTNSEDPGYQFYARSFVETKDRKLWLFFYSVDYDVRVYDRPFGKVWYKVSSDKCRTWSPMARFTDVAKQPSPDFPRNNEYLPAATLMDDGSIIVFWESWKEDTGQIYYKFCRDGSWTEDIKLTETGGWSHVPSATTDKQKMVWVFWQRFAEEQNDIWYNLCETT